MQQEIARVGMKATVLYSFMLCDSVTVVICFIFLPLESQERSNIDINRINTTTSNNIVKTAG